MMCMLTGSRAITFLGFFAAVVIATVVFSALMIPAALAFVLAVYFTVLAAAWKHIVLPAFRVRHG